MSVPLLTAARELAGLSKAALARRAGTSRATVSDYERGVKSPTLATVDRLVGAAGFDLALRPRPAFAPEGWYRGAPVLVPDQLPPLGTEAATAVVELPLHLEWSGGRRRRDLSVRADRIRVYELVLREGTPEDVLRLIDPTLLVDAFPELNLPRVVREAWEPAVRRWSGR